MSLGPTIEEALTIREHVELARWLADVSPLDVNAVIGLFHAVTVAPSVLPPPAWLSIVLPTPTEALDTERMEALIMLLLRLYNEVGNALPSESAIIIPEPDDIEGCKSFAAGFCAGAALDPAWKDDPERWALAEPFAYLCGRLDWVSTETAEALERDLAPQPKRALCQRIRSLVRQADNAFLHARATALQGAPWPPPARAKPKIGRNERCPCGSGKKYKHCCLRTGEPSPSEPS